MKFFWCQFYLFLFIIINLSQGEECIGSLNHENKVHQNLYNATYRALSSKLYPLCSKIFFNENNIQSEYISSKGFAGRILPIGTFPTLDLAVDYFYGMLCPLPNFTQPRKYAQSFDLVHVTYDDKSYLIHCEFILHLTNNTHVNVFAQMAFDEDYRICAFDGQIRNARSSFDLPTDVIRQGAILRLCFLAQKYCTGTSKQYASLDDCRQYLTTQIPFGTFDQADQGNVVCRILHANFIPLNPTRYCPRVGRRGGTICTDKTKDSHYNQPNFLACAHKYK